MDNASETSPPVDPTNEPAEPAGESLLDPAVEEKLPRRLQIAGLREWAPDLQNSRVVISRLSPVEAEAIKADQEAFIEDARKLLRWEFLPEQPTDWIYINDDAEQVLRWSTKDLKIRVRRWDISVQYRKKKEIGEAKLGAIHEELLALLLIKLVDDDGKDLPPIKVESFTRFAPHVYAHYKPKGKPLGDKFSELFAYFDGKLLLVSLIPALHYRPEGEWKGRSSKQMVEMLKKQQQR